jgi:anti-sigma regulatory factor (Ser/Thr protein kinase)
MPYDDERDFVRGAVDFLRAGFAQGDAALVVVPLARIDLLRQALDGDAGRVRFEDMRDVGVNPARIIPAWRDFLEANLRPDRAVRGIGEPIYVERSPAELVECQLHEALLNVAFAHAGNFMLLCPYDAGALPAGVLEEAHRSHPSVYANNGATPSSGYLEVMSARRPFSEELTEPGTLRFSMDFGTAADLGAIRMVVAAEAGASGLDAARSQALVIVVHEIVANSLVHGGGHGTIRCWQEEQTLVVEAKDTGRFRLKDQPLVGRVRPTYEQERGRGLWLANQLADLVQVRTSDDHGTAVRVFMHLG